MIKLEFFFGLVVIAQVKHPVPSRTRQLSTAAPMVLRLKTWESRSPPNLTKTRYKPLKTIQKYQASKRSYALRPKHTGAGWSSQVARQAHNLKVAGSNPAPATNDICKIASATSATAVFAFLPVAKAKIPARSPCRPMSYPSDRGVRTTWSIKARSAGESQLWPARQLFSRVTNTKLDAKCDNQGHSVNLVVPTGQISDDIGARALLSSPSDARKSFTQPSPSQHP